MKALLAAFPIVVVLGLTVEVAPVSAKSYANVAGGPGDASASEECPAGQYLVGVRIRSGAWWDQVTIACAPPLANGAFGPLTFGTPRGGNGGGQPTLFRCADSNVVTGADLQLTEKNRQVSRAILDCASTSTLQYTQGVAAPLPVSKTNLGGAASQRCSAGEAATGLNVRFGAHVNALGLICDTFRRPAAPIATVPAVDPAKQAAQQKALEDQIKYERQVTGKNAGECIQSNAMCESRLKAALGLLNAGAEIMRQCTPFYQQCMANAAAAADPAKQAAQQKALENQIKYEQQVTGKTADQCIQSNAMCEGRLRYQLGQIYAPTEIARQCTPFYQQCMANAAAAAASPPPADGGGAGPAPDDAAEVVVNPPAGGGGTTATVAKPVDVYDSPGGGGNLIGSLDAGGTVTLVEPCDDSWCHVRGAKVPGGEGFVYSGPDYVSLKF